MRHIQTRSILPRITPFIGRYCCVCSVDIKAGDQLIIKRGGGLGYSTTTIRAFAAEPNYYFEPFGAVMPDLSHIEVRLLQEERV